MRERADVTAVDTHGSLLRLVTGPTGHPPVASLTVPLDKSVTCHLDVLAASHRVRLTGGDGGLLASETVACTTGGGTALAPVSRWVAGGRTFVLATGTWRAPLAVVVACADRLRSRLGPRDDALVVDFPGPGALTALATAPGGWRSWHLYPDPDDPHLVATRTAVAPIRGTTP